MAYLEAVPGICMLVGVGRRVAAGTRAIAEAWPGSRTGPIHADFDAPATTVYSLMTTFDGGDDLGVTRDPPWSADSVVVREFATPVSLPLGITRVIRTREEIRLRPPDMVEFRHLTGPMRGMEEVIVVEPIGASRCRVTYSGELPSTGPVLRIAYRLVARPAIKRIVRAHLEDLARRATAEEVTRDDLQVSDDRVAPQ